MMNNKKNSYSSFLSNHSRMCEKADEEEYNYTPESDSESSSSSSSEDDDDVEERYGKETEKRIGHYTSSHRILLVGEGDFSFSLCLARAFGSARNMVATSLDKLEDIMRKYSNGIENVRELEERGCIVLYGVDATMMSQHFFLKTQRFDRIVYNFPHVGFLYREASYCQILLNKRLVKGFMKNAKALVREGEGKGEIHISHKEGEPYDKWDLVKKAEKIGLVLHESVPFSKNNYPGYDHKRAHGSLPDLPFHLGYCTTFKFKINHSY